MTQDASNKLLNIGPKSAAWLRQVGVRTLDDLRRLGAVGTFMKVKKAGFRPSLNLLYALAGAEQGVHWASLPADYKNALVTEVSALDDAIKQAKKFVTPARDIPVERPPQSDDAGLPEPDLLDEPDSPDVDADAGIGDAGTGTEASE